MTNEIEALRNENEAMKNLITVLKENPDNNQIFESIEKQLGYSTVSMKSGDANNIDTLTGLKRRANCDNEFEKMLSDSETDISFVMSDIDMFKRINDDFGHDIGDLVIKEMADSFKKIAAKNEVYEVYRYGGEEFLVVLPGMSKEDAFLLMEDIRKTPKGEACEKTSATISMGIATYPEDGMNWIELRRKVDNALYRAKASGRNKICLSKEEKLITKTVHYTVEQLQRLKNLSEEQSIGEAALMREALDDLLKKYNAKKDVTL
ncbi:MAG: diguanylate cyclase [Oscillospiraceae bacterium]|nr:diguanylate cyclase [Oscillospiraceae bacterium]